MENPNESEERPLLCNEVRFREDNSHFDRLQKLAPAFGRGNLAVDVVARLIFRTGLDVAESLIMEARLAVPAPPLASLL